MSDALLPASTRHAEPLLEVLAREIPALAESEGGPITPAEIVRVVAEWLTENAAGNPCLLNTAWALVGEVRKGARGGD